MAEDFQAEAKSVEERDREWLATVYRGDKERDLTVRAVLAGMIFGGLMSLSNLYVGLKTGWGLGVDIAAVVVIFAVFKALRGIGIVRREFGIMENTMMMTVAVAASWISSAGLVSAVPALTMLTGYQFVWWQLTLFIAVVLYLGLFMAIPLKRQMIQVDSLRFPANIPTGETLLVMYSHGGRGDEEGRVAGHCGRVGNARRRTCGTAWGGFPANSTCPWHQRHRPGQAHAQPGAEPDLHRHRRAVRHQGGPEHVAGAGAQLWNPRAAPDRRQRSSNIPHRRSRPSAAPQLPLAVKAGQTFTVQLEEAVTQPSFPRRKS